jgi:RNA polymerase-binding transcription factor DksA
MAAKNHAAARRRLEGLRDRLRPDVSAITDQTLAPSGGQANGELSNASYHLGDGGTEEYLHDLNATLLENQSYLITEVTAALGRVDDGSYGQCQSCGKTIAAARLEAIPYARFCVKCAADSNNVPDVNLDRGRPRAPEDTLAPEGEMGENAPFDATEHPFRETNVDLENDRGDFSHRGDVHAVGTPGGGGPNGGLAGTNEGHGDPEVGDLEESMGSDHFDVVDARHSDPDEPRSGRSGGAVGGTPAGKRARVK